MTQQQQQSPSSDKRIQIDTAERLPFTPSTINVVGSDVPQDETVTAELVPSGSSTTEQTLQDQADSLGVWTVQFLNTTVIRGYNVIATHGVNQDIAFVPGEFPGGHGDGKRVTLESTSARGEKGEKGHQSAPNLLYLTSVERVDTSTTDSTVRFSGKGMPCLPVRVHLFEVAQSTPGVSIFRFVKYFGSETSTPSRGTDPHNHASCPTLLESSAVGTWDHLTFTIKTTSEKAPLLARVEMADDSLWLVILPR